MSHKILKFHITFLTDAFLGGAQPETAAQWRTPPFKALLRQWWRVVYAESVNFQEQHMRNMQKQEYALFGGIPGKDAQQSRVRIRMDEWGACRNAGMRRIGSGSNQEAPNQYYIPAQRTALFSLLIPMEEEENILRVLALMDAFATVGRGSRNGYGSFALEAVGKETPPLPHDLQLSGRDWEEALKNFHWPQTIAKDKAGLLIWQTDPKKGNNIKGLITKLFNLRKKVGQYIPPGQDRRIKERVPNNLRFKIRKHPESQAYTGVIFHMPYANGKQAEAWHKNGQEVYHLLDEQFNRISQ